MRPASHDASASDRKRRHGGIAVPGRPPVTVHAVISSGLHAPWPFANTRVEDLLLDGRVRFRHRGAVAIEGTIETPAVGTAEGYARVDVRRVDGGDWRLGVALDLADGVTACERLLGPDGPMEPWRVEKFRG